MAKNIPPDTTIHTTQSPRLQTLAGFWRLPSKKLYITLAKWSEAGRCGVVEVAECGKYLEARENI